MDYHPKAKGKNFKYKSLIEKIEEVGVEESKSSIHEKD